MEKKLRAKLEDELKDLRSQQQEKAGEGAQRRFPQGSDSLEELRRKFSEAEEKVSQDKIFWKKKYIKGITEHFLYIYIYIYIFHI